MTQNVVEYLIDSFIDFKGQEHKIVACALSQVPEPYDSDYVLSIGRLNTTTNEMDYDSGFTEICRKVSIGISICHPTDKFNEETGKTKAYNKALHDSKCSTIYTSSRGVISKALVQTLLKQEIEFLKENPDRIIKGYSQEKAKFDKKQTLKNKIKNLSTKERLVIDLVTKENVNVLGCLDLIKEAKKAGIKINE